MNVPSKNEKPPILFVGCSCGSAFWMLLQNGNLQCANCTTTVVAMTAESQIVKTDKATLH